MNDQSQELIESGRLKAREIAVTTTGVQYNNFGAMMAFANQMALAGPAIRKDFRNNPGACLALVDDAIRYGMSPFVLARSAYVVNDQLAYQANIISAIILSRAPIKGRPKYAFEGSGKDLRCTVTIVTADGETLTHRSPPVGQIQPQNSPLWKTDPEQQLGYYTIRAAARRHFPDVMAGVYDLEEVAYAKTIEATAETSGLVNRLQGASNGPGFSDGHVERELSGDTASASEAVQATPEASVEKNEPTGAPHRAATISDYPEGLAAVEEEMEQAGEALVDPDFTEIAAPDAGQMVGEGAVQIPMTDEEQEALDQLAVDLSAAVSVLEVGGVWAMWKDVFEHLSEPIRMLALDMIKVRKIHITNAPKRTRAKK